MTCLFSKTNDQPEKRKSEAGSRKSEWFGTVSDQQDALLLGSQRCFLGNRSFYSND